MIGGRPLPGLRRARVCVLVAVLVGMAASAPRGQAPTSYRFTFAERERNVLQVEAIFTDVPAGPLQLRMSRSSPGRYALHDFAKNVSDVRATDAAGKALDVAHPNPRQWDITGHAGEVRVSYRVSGDRV